MAYRDKDGNIVGLGELIGAPLPDQVPEEAAPAPKRDKSFHDGDEDEPVDDGPWCLHITRTVNGYIAHGSDGCSWVFEEAEDGPQDTDPHAMARLLWHVIEYFGETGSRYDAARVRVVVEPGDKHSDGGEVAH